MRILLVSGEYPPEAPGSGGIGPYVACIAGALAGRGHEVHVLSCGKWDQTQDRFENGVWVHRRRLRRLPGGSRLGLGNTAHRIMLGVQVLLASRALDLRFDVIEYPEWDAEGWLLALLSKVATVAHLHTSLSLSLRYNDEVETVDSRLSGALEKLSLRRATRITSPSGMLADQVASSGEMERERIEVIPYPIAWREWMGIPDASKTPKVVQFVGRLEARKAPEVLADAIAILRREIPDAEARFAGEFDEVQPSTGLPVLRWAPGRAFDGCIFTGHLVRAELAKAYAGARVFAQPSVFENFSVAALEAMAAGRAAIVTSQSGLAEFVDRNGIGAVVPPRDPEALVGALRSFLMNPCHAAEIGQRAQAAVRRELEPERIAALREQVYADAIRALSASGVKTRLANG